jgi:hypothetical protein
MSVVRRFEHGSRVPGWDQPVDLEKDPAEIPDSDTTPVPEALRMEIERHMANYPDRRSAALPALEAAQRVHGWCSPEALEQVACVMRVTPAYLDSVASFYDMLETSPVGRHSIYVCTNISCSMWSRRAARGVRRSRRQGPGRRARLQRARLRVPGRVRYRADGVGGRRVRRAVERR